MIVYLVIGGEEEVAAIFYCKEDAEAYCVANNCYRVEEVDVAGVFDCEEVGAVFDCKEDAEAYCVANSDYYVEEVDVSTIIPVIII